MRANVPADTFTHEPADFPIVGIGASAEGLATFFSAMPAEGVFARVVAGGWIHPGDPIVVMAGGSAFGHGDGVPQ